MDWLHMVAIRLAPALASGLVTFGVAANHAEIIALGAATAVAVMIEFVAKWLRNRRA